MKIKKSLWPIVLIFAMASWATMYPFIKIIQGTIDPFLLSFFRFFFAAILIMPAIKLSGELKLPPKKDWLAFLLLSFITILPTVLIIIGVSRSTTMSSAILVNSNPIIAVILAPFLISEKSNWKNLIGVMIGFFGIIITILNGNSFTTVFASEYFFGSFLLLLAALFLSFFAIFSKQYIKKYGGLYVTYFTIAPGAIMLLIFVLIQGSFFEIPFLPWLTLLFAFLIAALATVVPYFLWNSSLKHLSVTTSTSFKLLIPIFATIYALMFLNEQITYWIVAGISLTSLGVYVVQKK